MPEILLILFVVLLLFGSKKLPGLARSLGRSINEFKKGKDEVMRELNAAQDEILKDEPPNNAGKRTSSKKVNAPVQDDDIEDSEPETRKVEADD